jgi:hypothetical protein
VPANPSSTVEGIYWKILCCLGLQSLVWPG